MSGNIEKTLKWLRTYIGKRVVKCSRADFLDEGKEDVENFGPLCLKFEDNTFITIDEQGDAESIAFSSAPIYFGKDEQDRKNYWKEIILDNKLDWQAIIDSRLSSVSSLEDRYENISWICGCRLSFDNGQYLVYYNYYDDAKVAFDLELLKDFVDYDAIRWHH